MESLAFKIIFVPSGLSPPPKDRHFLDRVQAAVRNCGVLVDVIDFSQVKKAEDEDYPEMEEFSVDVQGKITSRLLNKHILYKQFCLSWSKRSLSLPCSYIRIYDNDYFSYHKKLSVHTLCNKISFGVLPHDSFFYEYKRLNLLKEETADFYHDTRNVVIAYDDYDLKFSYENIHSIIINVNNPTQVFFYLCNPPLIFRREKISSRYGDSYVLNHRNLNFSFPIESLFVNRRRRPFDSNDFFQDIFDATAIDFADLDSIGRSNVLFVQFSESNKIDQIVNGVHSQCSEKPIHYSSITIISKTAAVDPVLEHMHFGCAYLLTAFFKRSFTFATQASHNITYNLRRLDSLCQESPECLEKALTTILAALDSGKFLNFWQAIESQFNFYATYRDELNFSKYVVPEKCFIIRRVTQTPTRLLMWPPEVMCGNRVLRAYDAEHFLRVSFRDDNLSRMSFVAPFADPGVLDSCIKIPMTNGLKIGQRHYSFLAWSNSQIRDHGVWMYAKDSKGRTVDDIRRWMGDFSHIKNVPKYMARMGQCFSQTEDSVSVPLDPKLIRIEEDVEGGYDSCNLKPYCFSDGVGRISSKLAAQVHKTLGHDKLCSAFQIRHGGVKGMLVADPTLWDVDIVFRKSMKKFDSPQNINLEIAKTSAPVRLQLNRSFIMLLGYLGVRHRTFMKLQENTLHELTEMLFDEKKAASFLTSKTPNQLYNYHDLSEAGIFLTTEPFFKSLLLALHRHHIEIIKLRANIVIDPDFGRNMLGVMDETGLLQYGEVFVQYTTDILSGETTKKTAILKGDVVVTKNPCLYPGDVRKLRAVDVPQLHHIVDCIVFPQRGPRPHPSEMAGSDLDGDEYAVLWHKDLIFYSPNSPAAHFPAVQSLDVPTVTVKHMIAFLQRYIKFDQVGTIANAHLAHADFSGPDSSICMKIAQKFSIAVDFAKNGKAECLDKLDRPQQFPDFMEKNHKDVYPSKKALGKMYRICKDFESENEETSFSYQDIKIDPDLVYPGWERYKDIAMKTKKKYNQLFRMILVNYGIQHEAEALSGAFTHLHCRFQERKDRNEIEKVVIGCLKQLQKSMRLELLEEFSNAGDIAATEERIFQKASACYCVTYSDPEAKFLSFPWILSSYLYDIKVRKTGGKRCPFSPAIMLLDEKIAESESKSLLPFYIETGIWNDYRFECDPKIVKHALRTLLFWGQEEDVVENPGHSKGLMFESRFIQLFLHVASLLGYVSSKNHPSKARKHFSSGHLCMEFLKFCTSFRFYTPEEMRRELVPFDVFSKNKIAKRAVVSYHKFALRGKFENLYSDARSEELITMKPIQINSKTFRRVPIPDPDLQKAADALQKFSKVKDVTLREIRQTKKVSVGARGSEMAIKELKSILRKKDTVLSQLFSSGEMPIVLNSYM